MGLPKKPSRRTLLAPALSAFLASTTFVLHAQPTTAPANDAPVPMEFPADGVELRTLVDIVAKRLKVPILYQSDALVNKRVILRVPVNVPESALMGILQSALRIHQLALVDADQPGWKQVVPANNLAAVARPLAPGERADPAVAVTQVFTLKHVEPSRIIEALKPFLTPAGNAAAGNVQIIPGQRAIIVSDYQSVLTRIGEILNLLDAEGAQAEVRFVPLKQAEVGQLVPILNQLLAAKEGASPAPGAAGAPGSSASGVVLAPDERLNQIIVVAPPSRMNEVVTLIQGLDKPVETTTKVYRLKSIAPDRVDKLIKSLLGPSAKRNYAGTVDRDSQTLVVSASADVHTQLEGLVKELDVYVPETESPIRFYKLKNTKAADVLATINGLYGQSSEGGGGANGQLQFDATTGEPIPATTTTPGTTTGFAQPNMASPRTQVTPGNVTVNGQSAALLPPNNTVGSGGNLSSNQRPLGDTTNTLGVSSGSRYGYSQSRAQSGDLLGEGGGTMAVHAPNATVAADPNTNSIIVIAPPAVQTTYAELIRRLDERRPQVQIECTIVTLDTSDGFSFGVDISKVGGFGGSQLLTFSSFGISTLNAKTGALTPVAAQGGTAALLSPGIADVVLRALATHSRSRLVSAPQLLVNDNGKGKLQSVAQQPFAEILDTASVQSRTGLGGQAEAGTTISVEPHISQDDYLQLSYSVELSAFTGQATAGLPPPSQKNTIDSTVTIPDGYTIVVGGLQQKNFQYVLNSLPIVENIPLVNLLFGSRSLQRQDTTLFVFIRPVILRDDKFMDLKYLSDRKAGRVGLPEAYPRSEPIPIK